MLPSTRGAPCNILKKSFRIISNTGFVSTCPTHGKLSYEPVALLTSEESRDISVGLASYITLFRIVSFSQSKILLETLADLCWCLALEV